MATLYIMFYQVMGVLATLYIRAGTIHRYIQHDNVSLLSAVPLTDIAPDISHFRGTILWGVTADTGIAQLTRLHATSLITLEINHASAL